MKHGYILAKDLVNIPGLPSTVQGIHKRAKAEGWSKEAVPVPGVRGRSFAYRVNDLPSHIQGLLKAGIEEDSEVIPDDFPADVPSQQKLMMLLGELSEQERQGLVRLLSRKGVESILLLLNDLNFKLLNLPLDIRQAALMLDKLPAARLEEILVECGKIQQDPTLSVQHKQAG